MLGAACRGASSESSDVVGNNESLLCFDLSLTVAGVVSNVRESGSSGGGVSLAEPPQLVTQNMKITSNAKINPTAARFAAWRKVLLSVMQLTSFISVSKIARGTL